MQAKAQSGKASKISAHRRELAEIHTSSDSGNSARPLVRNSPE